MLWCVVVCVCVCVCVSVSLCVCVFVCLCMSLHICPAQIQELAVLLSLMITNCCEHAQFVLQLVGNKSKEVTLQSDALLDNVRPVLRQVKVRLPLICFGKLSCGTEEPRGTPVHYTITQHRI